MKRIFLLLLCTFLLFAVLPQNSLALSAQCAILIDANTGRVLFSHNAEKKAGMASTTKIVTALCALENGKLDSVAKISPTAYGVEGSSMYLALNEELSLEDLLWGLMLVSGNDAATAIAEHISGSTEKFATLMNQTAEKAGAYNSHFTNPHGLSDENHYTTAQDLAKITACALKNPKFREIVSTSKKVLPRRNRDPARQLSNHNKLLHMIDGCIGVKTGFTKATGRCLVSAVERNGMCFVCVTLNAPDDWNDHIALFNQGFSEYIPQKVKTAGEFVSVASVKNGYSDAVSLSIPEDIILPLKDGEESSLSFSPIPFEDLQAPISKGDTIGTLFITLGSNETFEFPLVAAENIDLKKISFKAESSAFSTTLKKVFLAWFTCFN